MNLTKEDLLKLDDQVKKIGKFLGMEFNQEYADRQEDSWRYQVEIGIGLKRISFSTSDYKLAGRFQIQGVFPLDKRGQTQTPYNAKSVEITVAINRTAESIAKAIQSRLMPEYEKQLADALVRIESSDKYHNERLQTLQTVAKYFSQPIPTDDDREFFPEIRIGIYKINPSSEGLEFSVTCSTEKALRIFDILKGEGK